MKKMVAAFVSVGALLLVVGIILLIIGGTAGWNVKYTDEKFTSEGSVNSLRLDVAAGVTHVEFYDGDNLEIDYQSNSRWGFSASQNGGEVTLGHNKISWFFPFGRKAPVATVKIPNALVLDLNIDIGAGSVDVKSGTFNKLDVDVSAGTLTMETIECNDVTCNISAGSARIQSLTCRVLDFDMSAGAAKFIKLVCPDISLDVSAGSIDCSVSGIKEEYGITVDKSAGSCNVSSQTGTTDKRIDIDVSAGSVDLKFI